MADTKITALAAITTVDPAADVLPIVDISDTSMAASGTTKKITSNQILGSGGTATLASATITGDLTVDTSTLKVDSANNRVGIGTVTPATDLHIQAAGSASAEIRLAAAGGRSYNIGSTAGGYGSANNLIIYDITGSAERYRLDGSGNHFWNNVGGVAGTAMTLNSTGLGVGASPGLTGGSRRALTVNAPTGQLSILELAVNGTTTGYLFSNATQTTLEAVGSTFFSVQTNAVERLRVDASGNLLVGTTGALQLSNNVSVTSRIANLGTGSKGAMILRENEASAFWGGNLYLQKVRGTSTAVQSGDALGLVAFGGFDGTNYVNTATIQTLVTGAVSAGVVPVKIQVVATSGGVELTNTATSWAAISDERLKDIIEPINNAVSKVGLLRSVIGKYKSDSEGTRRSFLIAQDVQSALPEAVGGNEDSMTVRYTEVIPLLVAAIKELTARVQTLETR